jgi:hypothetical protein
LSLLAASTLRSSVQPRTGCGPRRGALTEIRLRFQETGNNATLRRRRIFVSNRWYCGGIGGAGAGLVSRGFHSARCPDSVRSRQRRDAPGALAVGIHPGAHQTGALPTSSMELFHRFGEKEAPRMATLLFLPDIMAESGRARVASPLRRRCRVMCAFAIEDELI